VFTAVKIRIVIVYVMTPGRRVRTIWRSVVPLPPFHDLKKDAIYSSRPVVPKYQFTRYHGMMCSDAKISHDSESAFLPILPQASTVN
jgi:hypothetical protein